jgi:hypothetical protein
MVCVIIAQCSLPVHLFFHTISQTAMPRKLKKQTTTVMVNGIAVPVILHPPVGKRQSWYAYWSGLTASKSTGCRELEDAIRAAQAMVGQGRRPRLADALLSDAEFEALQHAHFDREQDPAKKERAAKTLQDCLEAVAAFKQLSGLCPLTQATADDCARFQRQALEQPKNWRKKYPNSKEQVAKLSASTVVKWSRSLQAAWERANKTAGKKCVRGVVDEKKLLTQNPWRQFRWIGETQRPIRQFDGAELLGLLDHLEEHWRGLTFATALAKVFYWSWSRRAEVVGLKWSSLRLVGGEFHFESVGKWGVDKWFRIPEGLYGELLAIKTSSDYVFDAYTAQLRRFYQGTRLPLRLNSTFKPVNLGNWFYERIKEWSPNAYTHIYRKTTMKYARKGEDITRELASDIRVSPDVMMKHYFKEGDEEMRAKSNRAFARILAGTPPEVAGRYGHVETAEGQLRKKIQAAMSAGNWAEVSKLSKSVAKMR